MQQNEEDDKSTDDEGIDSAVLILILLGSAIVLLSTFLCCIYCRKSIRNGEQSKDKAILPDSSVDKTIETKKEFDDEKSELSKNRKPKLNVQKEEEVVPQPKVKVPSLKIDKLSN